MGYRAVVVFHGSVGEDFVNGPERGTRDEAEGEAAAIWETKKDGEEAWFSSVPVPQLDIAWLHLDPALIQRVYVEEVTPPTE